MYFVGIDISKYKHDCFICTETGEVICDNLSFQNTSEGFSQLLNLLKSLDNNKIIRIGFEATGHLPTIIIIFFYKKVYIIFKIWLSRKFNSTLDNFQKKLYNC